eukprot:1137203-Pelagomonas_calceolata.AAC.2
MQHEREHFVSMWQQDLRAVRPARPTRCDLRKMHKEWRISHQRRDVCNTRLGQRRLGTQSSQNEARFEN